MTAHASFPGRIADERSARLQGSSPPVPPDRRRRHGRLHHRPASRPGRQRPAGAQRPLQRRRCRHRRHGTRQPDQPGEPERRRALRRGLGLRRRRVRQTRPPTPRRRNSGSAAPPAAPATVPTPRRHGTPRADARAHGRASRQHEAAVGGLRQGGQVHRLSRDARQAERHRRRDGRHAGPPARGHRAGRDGSRQARLRAEAALLVGGRSAPAREEGR